MSKEIFFPAMFAGFVLLMFFICAAMGWPGAPDECITKAELKNPNAINTSCYCEPFKVQDVVKQVPGFRQPFNTFSNLYVLGTGAFLVFVTYKQREKREANKVHTDTADPNRFRNGIAYPIFYLIAVLFLGLGSMWFHASIVSWGGKFDQMSMYTLVSFLLAYSTIRLFNGPMWVFGILYAMCFILYLSLALIGADSQTVITVSMIPYGCLEIAIWVIDYCLDKKVRGDYGPFFSRNMGKYWVSLWFYWRYWIIGLALFGLAMVARAQSSDATQPLCIACSSAFQYHGVWHWLSGFMAVMLYFYWIKAIKR
jgi:Ceramidase